MKKFKNWVTYTLIIISFISIMFMCSDFENMVMFHLVHIVSFIVFVINTLLLKKYSNIFE